MVVLALCRPEGDPRQGGLGDPNLNPDPNPDPNPNPNPNPNVNPNPNPNPNPYPNQEAFASVTYVECAADGANSQRALCSKEDVAGKT